MVKINKLSNIKFINSSGFHNTILFIAVIVTQFSSINIEVIDWDESTFFIISKYISNGQILYVDYWDGKPPMVFFYLGIVFKLFGSSLLVGRVAGDVLIALTVYFVYKILSFFYSNQICFYSSLFLVYLFSYEASQPTMTEHLGILFVMVSMFLVFKNDNPKNLFLIGFFFSLSFNTRNNLAFASLAIVLYLLFIKKTHIYRFFWVTAGFLAPLVIISIYFRGNLNHYLYMLLEYPFQTTQSYRMNFEEFSLQVLQKLNLDQIISIELIIILILAFTLIFLSTNFSMLINQNLIILNLLSILFITVSIIFGGRLFNHYLIQLFPFISIIFASTLNLINKYKIVKIFLFSFTILININLFISGLNNFYDYQNIKDNYKIENISSNLKLTNKTTFLALENHLIYFYNDGIKPFKVVHPSGLPNTERSKDIFKSLEKLGVVQNNEFQNYVQKKPDYIFCEIECELYIEKSFYEEFYFLLDESSNLKLFQKK